MLINNIQYSIKPEANLSGANLSGANLSEADLSGADLSEANLSGANLSGADLRLANLSGADLSGANLSEADLSGADLSNAHIPPFQLVPERGSFHMFKKVNCGNTTAIIELLVPANAMRTSSLIGRKCRVSRAKFLKVVDGPLEGPFTSTYDSAFQYKIGEYVEVKDFDSDIRIECTTGIHGFLTITEARRY